MKVAVTGASGFIGRHVIEELQKHQVDVVAATRDAKKLAAWKGQVEIVEIDLGRASSAQLDGLAKTDVMIHLAWDGLPNYRSRHHFEDELPKQYGFLKGLIERGLPSLLIAGTCFEYGMQSGALSENYSTRPSNAYGFAKDCLRRQMEFLIRDFPLSMTWARLFYTYGEGQPPTSLYPKLLAAISRGDKTFDMSGGEQLRDYLPVAELARLIVILAMRRASSGVVNICAGVPVSVRRLIEEWVTEKASNIRLNLGRYPYPDYEPLAFWGDRSKLDRILDQS